ncbi:hypothetical protein PoB_005459500 [Plakobranchus ocellatus]|uniref:Uncharacterized protein n=1 Tax=Plakobranchus ocellatus TaxID=259542 RepID=A0AAV4C5U9_9GAST|nr:hypothetical protein PoB_005459500 [Plakobranchus ocellatus]
MVGLERSTETSSRSSLEQEKQTKKAKPWATEKKIIFPWTYLQKKMIPYERFYTGKARGQKRQRKTTASYFDNIKDWTEESCAEIFITIENREDWREMTTQ